MIPELVTTDGLVYLTDLIPEAVKYALNAEMIENSLEGMLMYIFEIDIDEKELIFDYDQMEIEKGWNVEFSEYQEDYTGIYSLEKMHSVGVSRNLTLGSDVVRYCILPTLCNPNHELKKITRACRHYDFNLKPNLPEAINQIPWVNI
jgi:hypothetical protein